MKKIFIIIGLFFLMPLTVNAANKIYSIDVNVVLNEYGDAIITETWDVDGSNGTEWYKVINNLGKSKLSDFIVSMDGNPLTYKNWNVDESLSQKKGYYGIVRTSQGYELCFGKYDYKRHKFVLNYKISNFVFNTSDSQVVYFNFIDRLSNVKFYDFSVNISSYYSFPNTLDVWGYGYKGYAYVNNGKIHMSNDGNMNGNYVVLLAKFPLNTFKTNNTNYQFNTFNDVYNRAEEGAFEYDYETTSISIVEVFGILINLFMFFIFPVMLIFRIRNSSYGYKDNKKININEVALFREIPCNKDIYYANVLLKLNNYQYKKGNILGAIILKWVREDKISFRTEKVGFFKNKEASIIDLTKEVVFENQTEKQLFDIMKKASKDGLLEADELSKWARKNYSKFLEVFDKLEKESITLLETQGHIYKRVKKEECKQKNVMDDQIYNDSIKLYGLKKYLEEFSRIDTKEVMEVKLWEEYLMFAYLFGIADKVAKQLKNMYPEIIAEMQNQNFDYNTIHFIHNISRKSVSSAHSARSAASSYSSGGGGFSSGGGGGGSSGGGGGGSR